MKVQLLTKYKTNICPNDYSHGEFLEGEIEVKNKTEAFQIFRNFICTGNIHLHENIGKYVENTISEEKTKVSFDLKNYKNHIFGAGFVVPEKNGYTNFYYLKLVGSKRSDGIFDEDDLCDDCCVSLNEGRILSDSCTICDF